MVWVGADLLYANKAILDKIKPGQCEPMLVYGSQKRVCVKNTKLSVPKAAQTPEEIRTILHHELSAVRAIDTMKGDI
jgi:hypothetical protein